MAINKYDFIRELIENKNIKPNQRERILELAAKEIGAVGNLENRIQEIEKIIFNKDPIEVNDLNKNDQSKLQIESETSKLPKYIYPYGLYKFLFEFNQNNILKSTCHDIDSDGIDKINEYCGTEHYDFLKHLEKIKEAYEIHENKFFAPPRVKALIRGYLTGNDYKGEKLKGGWSTDHIKINWSHPNLINWTIENPSFPPNPSEGLIEKNENVGFELNRFVSIISGNAIQNFRELVIHFKHLFHIRIDNSLREILEKKNNNEGWNKSIDFIIDDKDFPRNIEFFTDVDKLVQSYKKIIELIIKQNTHSKARVKLSFSEKGNSVELSIHHLNSVYGKTIENTIERTGDTYSDLIEMQINGLCNLYLKADFGQEKFAQINLWNGKKREPIKIDPFKGVEHILEFTKRYLKK